MSDYSQVALEQNWDLLALEIPPPPEDMLAEEFQEQKEIPQGIRQLAAMIKKVNHTQTAEVVVVATFTLYKATLDSSSSDSESSEDSLEDDYDPEPSDLVKKLDFSALE